MSEVVKSLNGQLGFDLGEVTVAAVYEPDRDDIRNELSAILATAQAAAATSPWDARTLMYHKVVFSQMSRWLPDEEREQLCTTFSREIDRIERLGAS